VKDFIIVEIGEFVVVGELIILDNSSSSRSR
jgi:hypothetical protein